MIIRDILVSNAAPLSKSVAWIKPVDNGLELLVLINGKWKLIASSLISSLEERIIVIENDINLENIGIKDRVGNLETGYGTISGNLDTLTLSVGTISGKVEAVESYIPTLTASTNLLADKLFVNSSISTNTATFKGTFNSVSELPTIGVDANDYAFIATTDSAGNSIYNRYKYTDSTTGWSFEYALNNSSFTAALWAAINSNITSELVSKLVTLYTKALIDTLLSEKVSSTSIYTITTLTQAQYDALTTKDTNTEYNII